MKKKVYIKNYDHLIQRLNSGIKVNLNPQTLRRVLGEAEFKGIMEKYYNFLTEQRESKLAKMRDKNTCDGRGRSMKEITEFELDIFNKFMADEINLFQAQTLLQYKTPQGTRQRISTIAMHLFKKQVSTQKEIKEAPKSTAILLRKSPDNIAERA